MGKQQTSEKKANFTFIQTFLHKLYNIARKIQIRANSGSRNNPKNIALFASYLHVLTTGSIADEIQLSEKRSRKWALINRNTIAIE